MKGKVLLLAVAFLVLGSLLPSLSLAQETKPNILFVLTDDQRTDDLRYLVKTRRLLGDDLLQMNRFFAPFPLCCPARMSIYTGQSAHNHGVDGNFPPEGYYGLKRGELRNTLPRWLQRAGYRTAHVGKFLNGYGVLRPLEVPPGWDTWHGTIDQTSYDYYNFWINDNGKVTKYGDNDWNERVMDISRRVARREYQNYTQLRLAIFQILMKNNINNTDFGASGGAYITEELGKRARTFIRQKSAKPWFLELASPAPHREDLPENAGYRGDNPRFPAKYRERVESYNWTNPPSYDESDLSDKPSLLNSFAPLAEQKMTIGGQTMEEMISFYRKGRAGALLALDDEIAKTIRLLKRKGQWKNTVFILTSDNGWIMGEHRIAGDKYSPFEESLRVPLWMSGPGVPRGTSNALGQNSDITKTILNLSKAKPKRQQEGVDIRASFKKKQRRGLLLEATRPLFVLPEFPFAWDVPYYGIRTERWKYVHWSYGEEELYDLQNDPWEMDNLADSAAHISLKNSLKKRADALRSCKGAACIEK